MLTRCPIFADSVALHAFTLALATCRRIPEAVREQMSGRWSQPLDMLPPPRTAMVIGLGCIGRELCALLRRHGLHVLGVAKGLDGHGEICDELLTRETWRDRLKAVDLCFLAIPNTAANRHFFDAGAISALPAHAVLVNVGRGSTLDVTALLERLRKGLLGGAALDVLEHVPAAADDPLWSTPRLLITPKVSTFLPGRQERLEKFIESQVRRYLAGEPVLYQVDYRAAYAVGEVR
jgi:phosphoglycerate dehydrogenase-like enzyme